jgi:hypothetical protein
MEKTGRKLSRDHLDHVARQTEKFKIDLAAQETVSKSKHGRFANVWASPGLLGVAWLVGNYLFGVITFPNSLNWHSEKASMMVNGFVADE